MNGESNHCAITVTGRSWSSRVEDRFQQKPALLRPSAGTYSCYIFRAPKSQVESNPNAYKPQIVSIGPYHHGKQQLELIEQHKTRVFSTLLDRTGGRRGLDGYFTAVASLETNIRNSYSEALDYETSDLIEMMVLDACFIELFRVLSVRVPTEKITQYDDDPLFFTPWIVSSLMIDLLLIENQIPFIVLQEIYALSNSPSDANRSLNEIALQFFNRALQWPEEHLQKHYRVPNITHLLDLFRLCLVGHLGIEKSPEVKVDEELLQLISSANQLLQVGIKFEPRKSENLIDVVFDHGVLRICPLTLDLFTSSFFLNCVAYEQCYLYCSKHISTYVVFMRCLMGTAADAVALSQCGIIMNLLGADKEVARFFNDLAKDVQFDIELNYLTEVFRQVNQYHRNKWRLRWAGIKREYFGSPWSFISAAAAFILLVLTVIQAFFTIYPYYHPK
ncbi:UPF0481 protein At3g47200 [Eucalyptus grandis]|uniref:Uncharacterized protein n=2 Tax=Eucalyptus grandis TaxID=71139 RepID=A0ACC3M2G9_EUCGR|nr:UPF0481 protein At3g47200 [Eucalyptus grandis]KAK3444882.1 hypothetical protein EUGRSUZ_A00670 [Eucalyptus grandis]